MNHIQNNQNPEANPYKPMDFIYLKKKIREQIVSIQMFVIYKKENHTLWYGFKIYRQSSLA
jgi:hypothetical protein